ncbi:MAG: undecaprenyl-diphosphate phosphatase [Myxococcota bacterium]
MAGLGLVVALAVLQGLTEFLPVSSSGHLRLLSEWFGVDDPQTLFDIVLHVGTLVPVMLVYRRVLGKMATSAWRVVRAPRTLGDEPHARLVLLVGVATVPTGIIAMTVGYAMEALAADIGFVAAALAVNGGMLLLLGVLQRRADEPDRRTLEQLRVRDALIVGTIQGLAIFRGISRSGSTITAGLLCGIEREAAAAFSFLLAIPAILGALVMEFDAEALSGQGLPAFLVGGVVSALSGLFALLVLLRMLRRGRLHHFAWYCFALAGLAFWWRFTTA